MSCRCTSILFITSKKKKKRKTCGEESVQKRRGGNDWVQFILKQILKIIQN
jgi:hypothetical protein